MKTNRQLPDTKHFRFESFLENAEANLESMKAAFQSTQDEGERRQLAVWVDYHQSLIEAKPVLHVRPLNIAFAQRLVFHGSDRSAEVISFDGGHTQNDAVLLLPQEGIAFMSDLLFIEYQRWVERQTDVSI
jgi:glyoxylase-like metal-dependent hydrolase (beta-lactamase superfamily II)